MHIKAEDAVANGAAWLDLRYPGWFEKIDLATLALSDCSQCVLGQMWTGCYSDDEKTQILPQVMAQVAYKGEYDRAYYLRTGVAESMGYQVLAIKNFGITDDAKMSDLADFGFVESSCKLACDDDCEGGDDYEALTDAWTRLVIQRRLDAHRDVASGSDLGRARHLVAA